jgi:hypothetical protein
MEAKNKMNEGQRFEVPDQSVSSPFISAGIHTYQRSAIHSISQGAVGGLLNLLLRDTISSTEPRRRPFWGLQRDMSHISVWKAWFCSTIPAGWFIKDENREVAAADAAPDMMDNGTN